MVDRELPDNPPPLAAGDLLLDRYRVAEPIGEGGHSRVFRGYDERLERPVCIKVFHRLSRSRRAYEASYEHFIQEAFSLSKLAHPSTLRIFDFGHAGDDGPPFQITELMNGGTLTSYVRSAGALPRAEVIGLVTALCGALSEAHALGIVHRDIKPGNILFSTAGSTSVLKLADFGIAKALSAENDAAAEGDGGRREPRMYSRRWAAPEQMTSYPVTPASDLYSLALVTIFALTGRAVFAQKDPGAAYAERTASDERIDEALSGAAMSASARSLLKKACSFDPRRRPASAEELGASLARALAEEPSADAPAARAPAPRRQRLHLESSPAVVGDQRVHLHPAAGKAVALDAGSGIRLEVTLVPAAGGEVRAHVKAAGGFVQRRGGRPSRAIQLAASSDIDVVAPNGAILASARIGLARREAGDAVLELGGGEVAVAGDACRHAVLIDFGADSESALVFIPPDAEPPAPPCAP